MEPVDEAGVGQAGARLELRELGGGRQGFGFLCGGRKASGTPALDQVVDEA
jgi:hypothetical protein